MSLVAMSDVDGGSGRTIARPLPDDLVEMIAHRLNALA